MEVLGIKALVRAETGGGVQRRGESGERSHQSEGSNWRKSWKETAVRRWLGTWKGWAAGHWKLSGGADGANAMVDTREQERSGGSCWRRRVSIGSNHGTKDVRSSVRLASMTGPGDSVMCAISKIQKP